MKAKRKANKKEKLEKGLEIREAASVGMKSKRCTVNFESKNYLRHVKVAVFHRMPRFYEGNLNKLTRG